MRRLVLTAPRTLEWQECPEPDLAGHEQALVRPVAVATCDLDHPMAAGRTPFPLPIAVGHEGIAEVVAVGDAVTTVRPGELVVVPFQPSCGCCARCRAGQTGDCDTVGDGMVMYGFGAIGGGRDGFMSDVVHVPFADAMLVRVPDGVDPAAIASVSDNVPDAWRTVGPPLAAQPGADVLVVGGGGSIGVYAAGLAVALGAGRVVYADTDAERLALASDLGADVLAEVPERAGTFPITVDASASAAGLRCACRSTDLGGTCTHTGILFDEPRLPLFELYARGLTLHLGRAMARPAIEPILDLVATGRFDPARVTTATATWDDAPAAWTAGHLKLVVSR